MWAIISWVNPNYFKPVISQQVEQLTGRTLQINGDIKWQWWPVIKLVLPELTLGDDSNPKTPVATAKEASISIRVWPLVKRHLEIEGIAFEGLNLNLEIDKNGNLKNLIKNKKRVEAADVDANIPTAHYFTLNTVSIANLSLTHGSFNLKNLRTNSLYTLDGITFNGEIGLHDFADIFKSTPINVSHLIQNLKAHGDLAIKTMVINKLKASNLQSVIAVDAGRIAVAPLTIQFYGGTINAEGLFNWPLNRSPNINLQEWIRGVRIGDLLVDAGYGDHISGVLNAQLAQQSNHISDFLNSLNGNLNFDIQKGVIKNIDILKTLQNVVYFVKHKKLPKMDEKTPSQTEFTTFKGEGKIQKGIMQFTTLQLEAPGFKAQGQGIVDVPKRQIDMQLNATLTSITVPEVNQIQTVLGGSIPLFLKGNFDNYQLRPDVVTISKAIAKNVFQEQHENIKKTSQKLKEKAGQWLDKLIKAP